MVQRYMAGRSRLLVRAGLALLLVTSVTGCSEAPQPVDGPAPMPFEGQTVRLLVLDDPAQAHAVRGLAGEWQARSGAALDVREASLDELEANWFRDCDAVIYPSHALGSLAEHLLPFPEDVIRQPSVEWNDVLPLLRQREAAWNAQTIAVPLGSPLLALYYRADWFQKLELAPPRTWREYQRLVELFQSDQTRAKLGLGQTEGFRAAAEPLAGTFASLTLLARCAPYVKHPDFYSGLFDVESMAPRLAQPPFVRGLSELVAAQGGAEPLSMEQVWQLLRDGKCAMAIAWPIKLRSASQPAAEDAAGAADAPGVAADALAALAVAPLPGATEVFHPEQKAYVPRASLSTPLLCASGRLASAVRTSEGAQSPRSKAAMHLVLSLAEDQWALASSGASAATAMFRASQRSAPEAWIRSQPLALAKSYNDVLLSELSRDDCLLALRIPGRARYLAALDQAVLQALQKEKSPQEALEGASAAWEAITAELDIQLQKKAYQASEARAF